jgi:ribosomal protein S18 acetylase RimI-like enzyme
MLITSLPRYIKQRDLTLRRLRILDGPFLSATLKRREDILKSSGVCKTPQSSGVCKTRQSGGVCTPRRTPWLFFYWWLRKTFFVAYCIERKSQTIGFIGLSNLVPGESAEISLVLFDSACRRRGYGTASFQLLSRSSFTIAFANTFIVRVRKDNESARFFWTSLGFVTLGSDGDVTVMIRRMPSGN